MNTSIATISKRQDETPQVSNDQWLIDIDRYLIDIDWFCDYVNTGIDLTVFKWICKVTFVH